MLARFRRVAPVWAALAFLPFILNGCQKVPLLAPSGSTITLVAEATALPINATAKIVAQVIEASGTPPHSGTQITFSTTLGSIQPANVETDVNGQATAVFNAGTANGTATITAISGGASASGNAAIKIAVGTAAVGRVTLTASPTIVPPNGGTTTLTAAVFDINGNPLPSAPVSFSTTAGTLDKFVVTTDTSGVAVSKLTTANQATVTATVGATGSTTTPPPSTGGGGGSTGGSTTSSQTSATVQINVAGAPTLVITPPTTIISAGLPASFTFAVTASTTNGSVIKDLTVDWGDGSKQDLGAVTGNAVVSHTYRSAGSFTITATVTDANGFSVPVSTGVTVVSLTVPITLTPPATVSAGLPAVFTVAPGTLPTGDSIRNVHMDWGDGSAQDLGSISGSTSVAHVFATAGSYTVTALVTDTAGNSSTVSTSVTAIPVAVPTLNITATNIPPSHSATQNVTFNVQVTAPTGVNIQDALIAFGDGQQSDLGGLNGTVTVQHLYSVPLGGASFTITLTVKDSLNRTTTGSTSITLP
jgi:adhesin/invasin